MFVFRWLIPLGSLRSCCLLTLLFKKKKMTRLSFLIYLRSCRSVSGSLSKEKWTSTTGGSYLLQLLLLVTKPEYEGFSAPSQGKHSDISHIGPHAESLVQTHFWQFVILYDSLSLIFSYLEFSLRYEQSLRVVQTCWTCLCTCTFFTRGKVLVDLRIMML